MREKYQMQQTGGLGGTQVTACENANDTNQAHHYSTYAFEMPQLVFLSLLFVSAVFKLGSNIIVKIICRTKQARQISLSFNLCLFKIITHSNNKKPH